VKVTVTKQFQNFIKSVGPSLDEILQKAEIPNILWKDELELSPEQYYHFLEFIGNEVTDEQILTMSDIRTMQMFLPMFYAALCSASGLEGLKRFAAYKKIIGPIQIDVTEVDHEVVITMSPTVTNQELPRILLLNEQLLMLSLVRTGTGEEVKPIRVQGPYAYGKSLKEYLGIEPILEQNNQLVFDQQQLKQPFITQNNIMLEYLEPELRKRLEALENDYSFVSVVQKTLYSAIPAGNYSIEEVARSLGLSVRSMQRMLNENGLTFKLMVGQVQQTLAKNYIREGTITTDDISILVGYQNTVSFMRAFKKWTGMTVTQYREKCEN
jgi:AraC-like DNA-binding protein